jgi:vacuolar-type H+-ATPase subunit F/Vma7
LSRILALVRQDLAAGFALTGIDVRVVADAGALRSALSSAVEGPRYGMVVVEEELMAALEPAERAAFGAVTVPLVIEVPGELAWQEAAEGPAEDYVARLIRRAVGYQLNIKL